VSAASLSERALARAATLGNRRKRLGARIEVGQRYQKAESAWLVWEVIEVGPLREGVRHYRVVEVGDPWNVKLLSEHTLGDLKSYRPVPRAR
jgi:hypothetical protein